MPTPDDLRKDKRVPWEKLVVCNGPKTTTQVRYKRIPKAKWHMAGERAGYARKNVGRVTTSDLRAQMHQEMMLSAAGNFSPLVFERLPDTTSEKSPPDFAA